MAGDIQPTPEQVAEQRREAHRDLVRAYKRLFSSADGRRVLADLQRHYGFDDEGVENDDYVQGCTGMDIARRDGTKSPIRYILKMRNKVLPVLGEKTKRAKAQSGTDESPSQP